MPFLPGQGPGFQLANLAAQMRFAPGVVGGQPFFLGLGFHSIEGFQPPDKGILESQVDFFSVTAQEDQAGIPDGIGTPGKFATLQDAQKSLVLEWGQGLVDRFGTLAVEIIVPAPQHLLGGKGGVEQKMQGDGRDLAIIIIPMVVGADVAMHRPQELDDLMRVILGRKRGLLVFLCSSLAGGRAEIDVRNIGFHGWDFIAGISSPEFHGGPSCSYSAPYPSRRTAGIFSGIFSTPSFLASRGKNEAGIL